LAWAVWTVAGSFHPGILQSSCRPDLSLVRRFVYASDAIDLIESKGPSNELLSSNAYNGFRQVVTNFNAVNDMTVYTYDSGHRLTGIQHPTGLVTTNF
jgi:YD repeat-containing protein